MLFRSVVAVMKSSAGQVLPALANDPQVDPVLRAKIVEALSQAFADSARGAGIVAFLFVCLGLAASLALPKEKPLKK